MIAFGFTYFWKTSDKIILVITRLLFCCDTDLFYNFGQFCTFVPQSFHSLSGGANAWKVPHRNAIGEKHGWSFFLKKNCFEVSRWMMLPSFKGFVMKDTKLFYMCILLNSFRTQLFWKKLHPSCLLIKHDTNDLGKISVDTHALMKTTYWL